MESIEVITDESNTSIYKKDIVTFVEQKHIDTASSSGSDNTVSVIKKEYKLVGDDIYIGKTYEDAPQWIRDFINNVVDFSIGQKITELNSVTVSLNSLIEELNIAKNTYTNSIISSADIDERINTAITTLNSSIAQSNANIIDLIATKATPDEATALSTNVLQASINNGEINSLVSNLQTSISNNTNSLGNNIDTVYAEMNGEFENIAGEFQGTAGAINTLEAYIGVENGAPNGTGALADIEILQKQNDGIIETITGTYDVMLNPQDPNLAELVITAEPYVTWKAQDISGIDVRLSHIGDVYIKYNTTSNGAREYVASYKFIRTIVDNTSPYATDTDGFTWALIVDQAAQDAYQQALNAYDLADNKRRVFTATPSGSIDEGDLWVTGTNPQVVKVYKGGNWELSDTQVDNFISVTYTPTVTSLQNQIDGKIESWYMLSTNDPKTAWTDAPTRAKHDGDMWYQTDTKLSYYYSSSTNSWNLIDDAKAIQALAEAATAQATADGKISSYYMSTLADANSMSNAWTATEKTNNIGDLVVVWDDSTLDNNGTWRWNGTSWVTTRDKKLIALASDVTNLSTELTNGTNTWASADSTLENSLRTEITDEGARVESKFAYNSNVNINGIWKKSGFGLTTNYLSGTGTEVDPYVSEFWIDASRFKFTNSNVTGSVAPFTIDATGLTPQITFNGVVDFTNTNIANGYSGTTKINGGAIETGTVTAEQINTVGLIAENISANEIVGKTITGGVINGARINGAIIKTSYLDLDGELEVLTNYIISLAMYNANPSLYTDAVYIEVDNEYRIPSLSVIKEPTATSLISYADQSLIGTMKSYNTANVGHNLKAVKIRPQITVGSPQLVFSGSYTNIVPIDDYDGNLEKYFYIPGDAFTRSRGIYAEVWFAGIKLIEAGAVRTYGGHYSAAFVRNSVTGVDIRQGVSNVGITNTVTMSTDIFDFEVYWRVGQVDELDANSAVLQIKLLPSDKVLGFDWTSGNGIEVRNRTTNPASLGAPYSTLYGPYAANGVLGPTIFINNMI